MTFEEILNNYTNETKEMVCESSAYLLEKKQGEFTAEDYYNIPREVMVELIDGVIYDLSAPSMLHQYMASELLYAFMDYVKKHGGKCLVTQSSNVQLDADDKTVVLPDISILCDSSKTGQKAIIGAPDMVVEILSPSTQGIDKGIKLTKYKKAGVKEYWIIDLWRQAVTVIDFANDKPMALFGFADSVPVSIYNGDCVIDFKKIMEAIEQYSC